MTSPKQRKVAKKIIDNLTAEVPMTGGDIVESSGYGKSMRLFPGRILESKGVKEELKRLGFSIEAADEVIWNLLHKGKKEETRLKAADAIYKRLGGYAPDKHLNVNVDLEPPKEIKELTQKLNEIYRGTSGSSDGGQPSTMGDQAQNKE